jgi:hypothetical protein
MAERFGQAHKPLASALEQELEALHPTGLPQLRAVWTERWGCASRLRAVKRLRLMIAWRR